MAGDDRARTGRRPARERGVYAAEAWTTKGASELPVPPLPCVRLCGVNAALQVARAPAPANSGGVQTREPNAGRGRPATRSRGRLRYGDSGARMPAGRGISVAFGWPGAPRFPTDIPKQHAQLAHFMNAQLLTAGPQFDPSAIYRRRDGIYATDLLIAGLVGLDFFSWLARKSADAATICRELGLAARPADVMLTYFAAAGFIEETGGIFQLTPAAREHLVKGSPWFIGPYYASLKDRPVCLDLLKVLRTGKPANWGSSEREKEWTKAMETKVSL